MTSPVATLVTTPAWLTWPRSPLTAVRSRVPSALKDTFVTAPVWPFSSARVVPVFTSHTRTVRSPLPVTIRLPSGLKATLFTVPVWPFSSRRAVPFSASQTVAVLLDAVLLELPVAIWVPSGLNATLRTLPWFPFSSRSTVPAAASQTCTRFGEILLVYIPPTTKRRPSGLNATHPPSSPIDALSVLSFRVRSSWTVPVLASHPVHSPAPTPQRPGRSLPPA